MKGKIKFFNSDKGYGFITVEDDTEIFFHISDFIDLSGDNIIINDMAVSFETAFSEKGDKAVKIRILEE